MGSMTDVEKIKEVEMSLPSLGLAAMKLHQEMMMLLREMKSEYFILWGSYIGLLKQRGQDDEVNREMYFMNHAKEDLRNRSDLEHSFPGNNLAMMNRNTVSIMKRIDELLELNKV